MLPVSVVIATRNRPAELCRTLSRLAQLHPPPPVIVVDNASDPPVDWLHRHPAAPDVVRLPRNRGGAARTVGVRRARTPYVAFSDDDSWWAPDALPTAVAAFERHARLGLVAARTLVGPEEVPDPLNHTLATSPLPNPDGMPGTAVLGCLACASVVRREAYLAAGGFPEVLMVGGEESILCYDLAAAGWGVRYLPEVIAHHYPSQCRPPRAHRDTVQWRNAVLTCWMRRRLSLALGETWRLARAARSRDEAARAALAGLVRRLPAALAARRPLPESVENDISLTDRFARI